MRVGGMSEVDEGKYQLSSFINYFFIYVKKLAFFFLLFCTVMLTLVLTTIIFMTTKFRPDKTFSI